MKPSILGPRLIDRSPNCNTFSMYLGCLVLALSITGALAHPEAKRAVCPSYALVVARGTGEPQGPSAGFSGIGINGMVNQTFTKVSHGIEYDVKYPANAAPSSPGEGRDDAIAYIRRSRKHCPKQKFALLGYSQGATVVLETLKAFKETNKFIKAVVLLGNPYQKAGQISTVDEKGGSSTRGKDGALYSFDPSIALSDSLDKSGKVVNICYTRDLVCTGVSLDTLNGNHFRYTISQGVQNIGAQQLISKLA